MQRYFIDTDYQPAKEYYLTDRDHHHAVHVMRMKVGTQCYISLREQISLVCQISQIDQEQVILSEVEREKMNKELPYQIAIACGYTKGDKLDLVVQKATELGVAEIIGFPATASVVKWDNKKLSKKAQRFEQIAKEAAEQSHRQVIPDVLLLTDLKQLSERAKDYEHVLIAYEEAAKKGERGQLAKTLQQIRPGEKILFVFGPEGGLSEAEVTLLQQLGAQIIGLGPRILRAETAPLYALSAVSYHTELFHQSELVNDK